MRAVEELLGLRVAGGFYQPLSGSDLRARGLLDGDSGVQLDCVKGDTRDARRGAGAARRSDRAGARGRGRGGARRARGAAADLRLREGRLRVPDDLPLRALMEAAPGGAGGGAAPDR